MTEPNGRIVWRWPIFRTLCINDHCVWGIPVRVVQHRRWSYTHGRRVWVTVRFYRSRW